MYTRMCRFVSFVCAHKVDSMANLKKTLVETCEIFSCASAWGWKSDGSLWSLSLSLSLSLVLKQLKEYKCSAVKMSASKTIVK